MKENFTVGFYCAVSVLFKNAESSFNCRDNVFSLDTSELEYGASAEDSTVDIEVWIFRGGGNESNLTALNIVKKSLLLLLVEVLNLVEIQ